MKNKFRNSFLALTIGASALISCNRDDESSNNNRSTTTETSADEVNDFVWKALNSWYYWQADVGDLADNRFSSTSDYANFLNRKTPDKLFYSLLNNYGTTDKYSWIEKDNEIISSTARGIAEVEKTTGLDFILYPKSRYSSEYVAFVNYVMPNSPAAQVGIKRGDAITKVNGSAITASNYASLLADSFTVSRAETVSVSIVSGHYQLDIIEKNEALLVSKTSLEENPIAYYKVFELAGKKIGYLVYNGFKIDYNDELNAQFKQMKSDGINELILDLRYNGGGSLTTAVGLAQMINGGYTGQQYAYLDFNSKHKTYSSYEILSNKIGIYTISDGTPQLTGEEAINSLSLPRLYVLVSAGTASASELTVTCLSKFINVETIGYYTTGKFVGSHTLYDSPNDDYTSYTNRNKNHTYKLQPITFAYYDKDKSAHPKLSDGTVAINPDYFISPYEVFNNIKEFGETTDPELKKALELITGTNLRKSQKSLPVLDYRPAIITPQKNPAKGLYISDLEKFSVK